MSIQEHLNKIRNAIKGSEVRESIAKGIETAYDDASEKDNANMEVKIARGTHPTLRDRLNEVDNTQQQTTAQLAHTDREARRKREPEDLSERTLGLITGEGESISLESTPQDNSVLPTKTTFARGGGGVNLWDGKFHKLSMRGGEPHLVYESPNVQGVIAKVKPNTTYTMSKEEPPSDEQNFFKVGFFNEKPVEGSTPTRRLQEGYDYPHQRTFTTEPDEFYVLIQTAGATSGTVPEWFQLNEGNLATPYIPPNKQILTDLDLRSMNALFRKSDKNLFDGRFYKGRLTGEEPHTLYVAEGLCTITKVKPNTTYTIRKSMENIFMRIGLFTNTPNYGDVPNTYYRRDTNSYPEGATIKTGESDNYMVVTVSGASTEEFPEWFQIEEGTRVSDLGSPYVIKESLLPNGIASGPVTNFTIKGDFEANYTPITPAFDISNHENINLDAVYSWFDDLVAKHPNLLSRELIVHETTGLPVYAYRSKPNQLQEYSEEFPKIIHLNGMHGSERQNTLSIMRFYKDLFDHWQESKLLELLVFNVEFLIVPAWNAWGFENNSYLNVNGVSFNSNFPSRWVQTDMSGPHPLSEPETQAVYDLIMSEENVIFGLEQHRDNPIEDDTRAMWVGSNSLNTNKLLAGWAREANADFIKTQPEAASLEISNIGLLEDRVVNQTGYASHAFTEAGFSGIILEVSRNTRFSDYHTRTLGKLFAYVVKELHNDKTKWL